MNYKNSPLSTKISRIWKKATAPLKWYASLYKGRAWYTKAALTIVSTILALFIWMGMVDINFLWLFGSSPGFMTITAPKTNEASEIYSCDGVLIGKFFEENRTPVEYDDVTPHFWEALISTEDERFYEHHGIDFYGMMGAMKDALTSKGARGASTLTQQLAKNMFHMRTRKSGGILNKIPGLRLLIVKTKEWIIATKIELIYDKQDILKLYANTVDFGKQAYGIKTAAKTYFNTTPKDLTIEQCAVLVGMLKATTYYNPIYQPEHSLERRNVVLANMESHGYISASQRDSLSSEPIKLDISIEEKNTGHAVYFREAVARHLEEWAIENDYDLYQSGLKIYTTIDSRMQKYAEQAVAQQMRQVQASFNSHWGSQEPWRDEYGRLIPHFIEDIAKRQPFYKSLEAKFPNQPDSIAHYLNRKHRVKLFDYEKGTIYREMSSLDSIRYMVRFMHCGMVAMEPENGEVRAWVGDIDFKSWQYDKVTAKRQPGSTFKLFVYAEAMNQGLTPCTMRIDEPVTLNIFDPKTGGEVRWSPSNASGRFSGDSLTLKSAFARSVNSIAVRLGQQVGIRNIIKTAEAMGIKSELRDEPSLPLGSSDVTLLEMVNAYSTVADNGKHHEPVLVTRILDKDGNEVYIGNSDAHKVMSEQSAFFMQQLLKAGVNETGGTSQALRNYVSSDTDWGGKTGTTNNNSDAWFIAVSPKLAVGAWVGGEYRSIHFRTGALGQGARTALPLCGRFLASVLRDSRFVKYHARWSTPSNLGIEPYMYNCDVMPVKNDTIDTLYHEEPINDERYERDYDHEVEEFIKNIEQNDELNRDYNNTPDNEAEEPAPRPDARLPKPRVEQIE